MIIPMDQLLMERMTIQQICAVAKAAVQNGTSLDSYKITGPARAAFEAAYSVYSQGAAP